MHAEDMISNQAIACFFDVIGNDEKQIETRQQRVGKGNIFMRVLVDIVLRGRPRQRNRKYRRDVTLTCP